MTDIILNKLKQIELTENVKILFAIEAGSRAWNFSSNDSDYDVRFVYCHPIDWYLSIESKRDVIEYPINDSLDINGWDLRKALKLFSKSNPSIMEWINSPIIYQNHFNTLRELKLLENDYYSIKNSLHHYLNMAATNYRTYLKNDKFYINRYFYVLRPLLSCMWIEKYQSIPSMDFGKLINELIKDSSLKYEIHNLLERKRNGEEFNQAIQVNDIINFIENSINYYKKYLSTLSQRDYINTMKLDHLFKNTLFDVWK